MHSSDIILSFSEHWIWGVHGIVLWVFVDDMETQCQSFWWPGQKLLYFSFVCLFLSLFFHLFLLPFPSRCSKPANILHGSQRNSKPFSTPFIQKQKSFYRLTNSAFSISCKITGLQNGWGGKEASGSIWSNLCSGRNIKSRFRRATSRWFLRVDLRTSLGILFQCSIICTVKKCFLMFWWNLLFSSVCFLSWHWASLKWAWFYPLRTLPSDVHRHF